MEDASCDETSKGSSKDVTGIEDGNTSSDFFSGIENGEKIDSSGVVRGLSQTEEEASEEKSLEVLGNSSQGTDNGPKHHHTTLEGWSKRDWLVSDREICTAYHVSTGASSGEEHVGGDLSETESMSVCHCRF